MENLNYEATSLSYFLIVSAEKELKFFLKRRRLRNYCQGEVKKDCLNVASCSPTPLTSEWYFDG
jgi:hypothetical protein